MFDTVEFQDVTLGIFPLTADTMQNAFGSWPQNSVGDVVDMILQALEVGLNTVMVKISQLIMILRVLRSYMIAILHIV